MPYPVYKTVQPASQVIVLEEGNVPIEAAKVILRTSFAPAGDETREIKMTDQRGIAEFEGRSEWQQESFTQHGARYYRWEWCVQKPGFKTYITGYRSGNRFEEQSTIRLSRGTSSECEQAGKDTLSRR